MGKYSNVCVECTSINVSSMLLVVAACDIDVNWTGVSLEARIADLGW